MDSNIKIAPSLLSADFSQMARDVKSLELGGADMLHCDVMDGVFVKNISFGPKMVADIRKHTNLELDCHLMIVNPQNYIKAFAEAGADFITVHYEACGENLEKVLQDIKQLGVKCGAVISPDTPPEVLKDVLHLCDMVLVMSVYPGFGGQSFIESSLEKVKKLRHMIDSANLKTLLQIDGGISLENANRAAAAGADVLVAGSAVFSGGAIAQNIKSLKTKKG